MTWVEMDLSTLKKSLDLTFQLSSSLIVIYRLLQIRGEMNQDIQQVKRQIFDELTKIVDPEIGVSIMELELIDKVDIK